MKGSPTFHRGSWPSAVVIVLASALLVCGCESREATLEQAEAFLKERSSPPRGKAGMLRALEVVHLAHGVAERHGADEQGDCRLRVPDGGAYTYESTLTIEREVDGQSTLRWRESRATRRDGRGGLAVTLAAESRTELSAESSRKMSWRLVDGTSYLSGDARSYYAHPVDLEERDRLVAVGWGTLQTLLDAVRDGWQRKDEQPRVWTVGGERLICGPSDPLARGWLRRLADHATPVSGRLEASAQRIEEASSAASRTLKLRWQLDDGTTLRGHFEDRLEVGAPSVAAPTIDAPEAGDVVTVERDRSLERVDRLLDKLARERAIEKLTENTSDESAEATGTDDESK